jgi:LPS-assembly lipoprotein
MSWFELGRRRILAGIAFSACALALQGCQVQPLYATASPVKSELASISVDPVHTRVAQQVRNHLIFLFSGGAGEPVRPAYDLKITVTAAALGVFIESETDSATAGNMRVTVNYTLRDNTTQKVVARGKRMAVAAHDLPRHEFEKIRSARDAEDRAARAAAELVRADIAAKLAR